MAAYVFDEVAREIAAGTSRRRALRLLVGAFAGLLFAGVGRGEADNIDCRPAGKSCRGRGIPCCNGAKCCGEVCCAAGQECDESGHCVTPPPPPPPPAGPNRQICVCNDGTLVNLCAQVDCLSAAEQDALCGPACLGHLGVSATGCIDNDPACVV